MIWIQMRWERRTDTVVIDWMEDIPLVLTNKSNTNNNNTNNLNNSNSQNSHNQNQNHTTNTNLLTATNHNNHNNHIESQEHEQVIVASQTRRHRGKQSTNTTASTSLDTPVDEIVITPTSIDFHQSSGSTNSQVIY